MKPVVLSLLVAGLSTPASAQGLLNKIKQKAADAAEKVVDQKTDELLNGKKKKGAATDEVSQAGGSNVNSGGNFGGNISSGALRNKTGVGLVSTPPDVKENLNSAETAFKSSSYGEARSALQQAILGVELEIGQSLLKSLPETVSGLPKQVEKDQVVSSGWGWAGLTIHREYMKEDKQLSITIANNAIMMNAINMFLNSGFAQTSNDQNWKQTKLKGNKAIIQFEQSSGYKLSVPLGQSTMLVFEGINFENEQELMQAAEQFNVESIKKTLGEK